MDDREPQHQDHDLVIRRREIKGMSQDDPSTKPVLTGAAIGGGGAPVTEAAGPRQGRLHALQAPSTVAGAPAARGRQPGKGRSSDRGSTSIRRRRQCSSCGARFTTFERVQLREVTVATGRAPPAIRTQQARTVDCARMRCPSRKSGSTSSTRGSSQVEKGSSDRVIRARSGYRRRSIATSAARACQHVQEAGAAARRSSCGANWVIGKAARAMLNGF